MSFQRFHLNCSCNIFAQKGLRKRLLWLKEKKYNLIFNFNVSCGNTGDEFC
uniref:Uncharacterized protein n=5 Tax=Cercopithecidae TaxID=9527 RepID=A0A2K5XT73_MANLE